MLPHAYKWISKWQPKLISEYTIVLPSTNFSLLLKPSNFRLEEIPSTWNLYYIKIILRWQLTRSLGGKGHHFITFNWWLIFDFRRTSRRPFGSRHREDYYSFKTCINSFSPYAPLEAFKQQIVTLPRSPPPLPRCKFFLAVYIFLTALRELLFTQYKETSLLRRLQAQTLPHWSFTNRRNPPLR